MNEDDNALDDFEQDFPNEEQSQKGNSDFLTPQDEQIAPIEKDSEDIQESNKNRQHRRTSAKLESERKTLQEIREANIKEAGRLEALSEQRKFLESTSDQTIDERLLTLYGSDANGKKAAQITQSLLEDTARRARELALEDFKKESRERERAVAEDKEFIDGQLQDLEDTSGMELTSNTPLARKNRAEFLDMVSKFSSKDRDGDIQEYADFNEVFNVFKQTRKSANNSQQKDLASRGMARGGSTQHSTGDKAVEAYLRNAGII